MDRVLGDIDERQSQAGDDYPARVYVVVSGGAAFWKTRSLVYVWSSNQPVGATRNSAYTDNVRMMALYSVTPPRRGAGSRKKRDVRADFRRLFGEDIDALDAVALMTDSDSSGQTASAWYGDIRFTAR